MLALRLACNSFAFGGRDPRPRAVVEPLGPKLTPDRLLQAATASHSHQASDPGTSLDIWIVWPRVQGKSANQPLWGTAGTGSPALRQASASARWKATLGDCAPPGSVHSSRAA